MADWLGKIKMTRRSENGYISDSLMSALAFAIALMLQILFIAVFCAVTGGLWLRSWVVTGAMLVAVYAGFFLAGGS